MSLRLLHRSDSKSTSTMLASTHLPDVTTNHNLRLPHSYTLAACRWLRYNGFPPKPPIPPDPPPSPSPMTRIVKRPSKPPLSHSPDLCKDASSYLPANHQNRTKSLTRTHHTSLIMAAIYSTTLPPLRFHHVSASSLVSHSRSERQVFLLHAITSATSVLLKLPHLRPPAIRSRNGNRRFSDEVLPSVILKTAISAVSSIEIQHVNVFSNSQSLVSLVISSSDVNELRSVLVDNRSLLETFSCISVIYISYSATVLPPVL